MRKKTKSKGDILIDLTSLLDVIFILLLVVLCYQKNLSMDLENKNVEAEKSISESKAEKKLYEDQMDTVKNFNVFISVYSTFDLNNPLERDIRVLTNDDEMIVFKLEGNAVAEEMENLKNYLKSCIDQNPGKPVVLSLNEGDDDILYRDERAIKAIYEELSSNNSDVYIKK